MLYSRFKIILEEDQMEKTPIVKIDRPIRNNNAVANIKEMQKSNPHLTFEREYDAILTLWTLHDYSMFSVMEKELGTDKAVNLYARVWELRSKLEWPDLCEAIGKKPSDKFTIDDVCNIMITSFADFGNSMQVVEKTEDRVTLRNFDCPYITQIIWNRLSRDEALEYNRKIQIACNHAIFETYLKLAGLYDDWTFNFPSQLCMTNQYCEFTFIRNKIPKN
jgi:hypothetical protein